MATVRELITKLGFKVDEGDINHAESRVKKMSMGMKLAIGGAVAGVFAIGKSAISAAGEMEMMTTQFEVMLGSTEAAVKMMDELKSFSATTPFQLEDLAKNTQMLLSFGIAQEDVMGTLQMLGDTAGGNADKLNSLSLAYGKVATKGKASLEELNMMAERGLPIFDILSQQLNVTKEEMFKMVSTGQITTQNIKAAFETMTGAGGMFFEGMKKQSLTFEGMMSTLKDNLKLALAGIGEAILPIVKDLLGTVTSLIQGPLGDLLKILVSNLVPVIKMIGDLLGPIIQALIPIFNGLMAVLQPLIDIIMAILIPIIEALTPVIAFLGMIFDSIGVILKGLLPVFVMLGEIIRALLPILGPILELIGLLVNVLAQILTPIIAILAMGILYLVKVIVWLLTPLKWIANYLIFVVKVWIGLFKLLGRGLSWLGGKIKELAGWLWGLLGDSIDWVLDQFTWVGDLFTWLGEVMALYLGPIIDDVGNAFNELGVVLSDMINWIGDKIMWIGEVLGLVSKPIKIPAASGSDLPTASDMLKGSSGSSKQTNINMQNQFAINAPGGVGSSRGARKAIEEAARSIFSLELQKLVINAGL